MDYDAFLASRLAHAKELEARFVAVTNGLTVEELSRRPSTGEWGLGEVIEHLNITYRGYLPGMEAAIRQAPSPQGGEVRIGWLMQRIIASVGPSGNSPVPPNMRPGRGPWGAEHRDEFLKLHNELIEVIRLAHAHDARRVKFIDEFVRPLGIPLVRFWVIDGIELMVVHTERHVQQMEARRPFVLNV